MRELSSPNPASTSLMPWTVRPGQADPAGWRKRKGAFLAFLYNEAPRRGPPSGLAGGRQAAHRAAMQAADLRG